MKTVKIGLAASPPQPTPVRIEITEELPNITELEAAATYYVLQAMLLEGAHGVVELGGRRHAHDVAGQWKGRCLGHPLRSPRGSGCYAQSKSHQDGEEGNHGCRVHSCFSHGSRVLLSRSGSGCAFLA